MAWQTDWGEEFGGSNLAKLHRLQEKHYKPLGARLARIPLGRKEHNGRVEHSHRTDDEDFYIPLPGKAVLLQHGEAPLWGMDERAQTPSKELALGLDLH